MKNICSLFWTQLYLTRITAQLERSLETFMSILNGIPLLSQVKEQSYLYNPISLKLYQSIKTRVNMCDWRPRGSMHHDVPKSLARNGQLHRVNSLLIHLSSETFGPNKNARRTLFVFGKISICLKLRIYTCPTYIFIDICVQRIYRFRSV